MPYLRWVKSFFEIFQNALFDRVWTIKYMCNMCKKLLMKGLGIDT